MSASTNRMLSFAKTYGKDMIRALDGTGIYFPVMLVQACLESGYGTSYAAVNRNNFFGIKGGKAKFKTPYDCFAYYSKLLSNSPNYEKNNVANSTSPYSQITNIANSGYYNGNDDDTLPASKRPPKYRWTAQTSAKHYYDSVKPFLDGILLVLPIGLINSQTASNAGVLIANSKTG